MATTAKFSFQRLLPSSEKVSRVEFHPELPLLATIDRRSYLTIWDYHRGEPLFECQFGENSLYNKDTLDAIARAEANPDHFGRPLHPYMQANYLTPSVYGKLKNVAFLDIDTVCWTIAVQRELGTEIESMVQRVLQLGATAQLPALAQVAGLAEQRRVILTCEKATVLLDIISKRVATIPSTHYNMGGKAFSMALALPRDSEGSAAEHVRVAIASVDGTLRVVNGFNPDSVVAAFATKKDIAISAMAVVPIQDRDAIFAGDEKGNLFVFDPTYAPQTAPLNKDGTRAPSATLTSFHKDTIHSICFAAGPDASNPKPRVITASACNRIGVWDIGAEKSAWGHAQLLHRVKTKDITITGACALMSGVYTPGMTGVLLSTNTAEIYGVALDTNTTHPVIDMASNLPARDAKKGAKLYAIASPLLHPEVCAAATNAGIAILRAEIKPTLAVCGLTKLASFASVVVGEGGDLLGVGEGGDSEAPSQEVQDRSASVVIVAGSKLIGSTYTTSDAELTDMATSDEAKPATTGRGLPARLQAPGLSPPLDVHVSETNVLADLAALSIPSPVTSTCSASGARVSVCSQKSHEYAIFYKPEGRPWRNSSAKERLEHLWPRIDAGSASQVVWHFRHDVVALLAGSSSSAGTVSESGKSEGGFFSRKSKQSTREQEFQRQAASMASASSSKSGGGSKPTKSVTIRNVATTTFGSATTVVPQLVIPDGVGEPTAIHGGILLGVSVSGGGEKEVEKLLLYDWNGGLLTAEYAALLYRDAVEVYSLHTSFSLLTRISVHVPLEALWLDNTLFTSSPSDIAAHFIIPPAPKGQQLTAQTALFAHTGSDGLPELSRLPTASAYEVQSVVLATNRIGIARPLSNAITQPELPPMPLRPGMLWKLVRVTQDTLWMVATSGHAWAMSLRHAGLKCRILATQGDLQGARKMASAALHHRFHDNLARMFCSLGALGAAEALLLPGLSLELELALAIKCGALRRGYACLAALLAGCTDRVLLSRFAAWNGRDKDPDAPEPSPGAHDHDPFGKGNQDGVTAGAPKVASDVIAVFKQAAGANADQILKRIADYGVQGRKDALDADMFTSPDVGDAPSTPHGPSQTASAPPPSSEKYKPMFPRGAKGALVAVDEDGEPEEEVEEYADVIDWEWPLRPPPPAAPEEVPTEAEEEAAGEDGQNGGSASPTKSLLASPTKSAASPTKNGADAVGGNDDVTTADQKAVTKVETPLKTAAAIPQATLELGLRLLDASVLYADTETLQATIQLMAPHTNKLTQSQQARLVAAVGAAGAAQQLSDLTLKGTASLLPSAAMLAGFLAGDARVAARVLEKQGFLPLQAMFCQSCGAGGVEASVKWESQLKLRMGGPTRELTITPQTT